MKLDIKKYLKSLPKDEPVYYFPNPGNGGDSLIACATFQALDEADISYLQFKEGCGARGKTLLCFPGGNFISHYPNTREFVEAHHQIAKRIIILPSTIFGHRDLLEQLGSNVDIILREDVSYDYVLSAAHRANIYKADDMALSRNLGQVLNQVPILFSVWMTATIPSRRIQRGNYFEIQQYFKNLTNRNDSGILNAFRTDREKTDIQIPQGNLDIAEFFAYGTTRNRSIYATHRLLNFINQYSKIRTNRLHTCIAGALLGKEVEFYANNYWKCEAVYKFSIKEQFPNTKWI